jgi:hypothetical protein
MVYNIGKKWVTHSKQKELWNQQEKVHTEEKLSYTQMKTVSAIELRPFHTSNN